MAQKYIDRRSFLKVAGLTVAAAPFLSYCTSAPQATTAPAAPVEPTAAAPTALEGKVTVWAWEPLDGAFNAVVPEFQKKYPKIQVEVVNVPWDDIHTKLTAAIEAGSGGPDLCAVEGYIMPSFAGPGVMDLTKKLEPYRSQIAPGKFNEIESEGKLWGIPSDPPPGALIYRADIFEEAGLKELPTQWEEFLKVVGEKVVKPGERYLFGMDGENSPTFYWWRPLAAQLGTGYFGKDGSVAFGSPEAIRVTKWMYDAQNTYEYALKGVNYWESPAWWSTLKDSKVVAAIAAPWMVAMLKQEVPEQAGKWKALPMPVWEKDNPQSAMLGGASCVIPAISKNQELAWAFAEFAMLSKEGCVAQYKASGIWPSYLPSFDDAIFDEQDEYFGGQKLSRLYGDLTKGVSGVYYTRNFSEVDQNAVRPHLFKIFNNEEKLEEGMKKAAEEIQAMSS